MIATKIADSWDVRCLTHACTVSTNVLVPVARVSESTERMFFVASVERLFDEHVFVEQVF